MGFYLVDKNENFIGRDSEWDRLVGIEKIPGSKIIVMYGRRRVGKTELLEQVFRERNLLKFEGLERKPEADQMNLVMRELAAYAEQPLLAKISVIDWIDVLKNIADYVKTGTWTLYFEELQWLAQYRPNFVAALKYVWDNYFRHNKKLIIILCGSSPSFMINEVVKSRALYNRSQYEIPLRELTIIEAKKMLPQHSDREVMDAYLTVGGMPEYLLRFGSKKSVYITLYRESFMSGAFFSKEADRVFTSSMSDSKHYKKIIQYLSRKKFSTRNEILKHLKLKSGGEITDVLHDLEVCGFIDKYTPFNLASTSTLARYCITDSYLQFYFKFIQPIEKDIANGDYDQYPDQVLKMVTYQQWLGYAFERFCRKYHRIIASMLGFRSVQYKSGAYFKRGIIEENSGFQIDLLFDREDKVITICEIRYSQSKISVKVIDEFEKKLENFPNPKHKTIERVLITINGADESLKRRAYFDVVLTLEDFLKPSFWGS